MDINKVLKETTDEGFPYLMVSEGQFILADPTNLQRTSQWWYPALGEFPHHMLGSKEGGEAIECWNKGKKEGSRNE